MKTLKVKSILFSLMAIMAIAVVMTSCSKEEVVIPNPVEQVAKDDSKESNEKRNPFIGYGPCGYTGGTVLPNVKTKSHCNLYWGTVWSNGQCWWCY